jgi:hypothetical protein
VINTFHTRAFVGLVVYIDISINALLWNILYPIGSVLQNLQLPREVQLHWYHLHQDERHGSVFSKVG